MTTDGAWRWIGVLAACLLAPLALFALPGPSASAQTASSPGGTSGPAMLSPAADRADALSCTGDLTGARRTPVLLVPGTGMTPIENWGPTYRPVLLNRGYPVCMVRLPALATRDVQVNVEYVATAIRTMSRRAGRRISTIGVSQGGLLPIAALRTWPDLRRYVDDVIGLASVYDRGSEAVAKGCRDRCLPALHQLATGSRYLTALGRRPLPEGPSYTNIGAKGDHTVTPQPKANQLPGATSIMVQDACPWHTVPEPQHAMLLGDAVALELTLDALEHDGVASPSRLRRSVCWQRTYAGFDLDDLLSHANHKAQFAKETRTEPALFCRNRPSCRDPLLRGRALGAVRYSIGRDRITIRTRARVPGRVKAVVGGRAIVKTVRPGKVTLRVPRPAATSRLVISTRPRYYTAWAAESRKSIRGRHY